MRITAIFHVAYNFKTLITRRNGRKVMQQEREICRVSIDNCSVMQNYVLTRYFTLFFFIWIRNYFKNHQKYAFLLLSSR